MNHFQSRSCPECADELLKGEKELCGRCKDAEIQEEMRFKSLGAAYQRVQEQIKQAGEPSDYPRLAEPIEESGLVYPQDKVIEIKKGRKLTREAINHPIVRIEG